MSQELPNTPTIDLLVNYWREATKAIDEADLHAKKELKKQLRGGSGYSTVSRGILCHLALDQVGKQTFLSS